MNRIQSHANICLLSGDVYRVGTVSSCVESGCPALSNKHVSAKQLHKDTWEMEVLTPRNERMKCSVGSWHPVVSEKGGRDVTNSEDELLSECELTN